MRRDRRIVVEGNMGAISAVMQYGTEDQKKRAAEFVLSGDKPPSASQSRTRGRPPPR